MIAHSATCQKTLWHRAGKEQQQEGFAMKMKAATLRETPGRFDIVELGIMH